jgi:MYXO-CTERM domain-containing protein
MAHTHDPSATMWPAYTEGSTSLRTLSSDDVAGICAIYPPGGSICSCDPTPRHGFSAECAAQQSGDGAKLSLVCQDTTTTTTAVTTGSSCAVAPVAEGPPSGRCAAALAALGAVLLAARRKRRG